MNHYCHEHNSKFYRNEKNRDDGSLSVWYSHKLPDGSYCNEKTKGEQPAVKQHDTMLMCNAMNNATALVAQGRVDIADIEKVYKRILEILETT